MKTLKQIRDKVIDDLDLEEESFVDKEELNEWIRDGVNKVQSNIHTLYEDYFLSNISVPLVEGQNLYDFPADIFANKIRMIMFYDGNESYEIKRSKHLRSSIANDLTDPDSNNTLTWYPVNNASNGRKIRLFPSTTDTGNMEIWYIRNAKELINDDDVCDIDEYSNVVELYVKTQVFLKDGDVRAEASAVLEKEAGALMVTSLSEMVIDDENEVEPDYSFYEESV